MKKMLNQYKDMSKLSVSLVKIESLIQVNYCFKAGPTLLRRIDNQLRGNINGFPDPKYRREDSDPFLNTCTDRSLIIFQGRLYVVLDCIRVKYGNLGKSHYLLLTILYVQRVFIFNNIIDYCFLNIFLISINIKCFFYNIIVNALGLDQSFLKGYVQKKYCQDGGKKTEEAIGLDNSSHIYIKNYFYNNVCFFNFKKMLNSEYLNFNQKENFRHYSAQDLLNGSRLKDDIFEWPSNEVLLRLENEIIQKQITLVDLAVSNGLFSKSVKKFQTRLMRSLKFRIIAMYKISKNRVSKRVGNYSSKFKLYWEIVKALREIIYYPKNYRTSPVKKVWIAKSNKKKRAI